MSILRIPNLKKLYGTTEFAIDRLTGQLYKIGDVDVTPVNLFGGIPDERLRENDVETTTPLLRRNPKLCLHPSLIPLEMSRLRQKQRITGHYLVL